MKYEPVNGWKSADKNEVFKFSEKYKDFLDNGKTERLCVKNAVKLAKKAGFSEYKNNAKLNQGDKIYINNRDKSIMLAVIGSQPITDGIRLVAAHIDSPRLDLKPNPLYEDTELALFKTHYYGGIKKYQWTTVPLAMYGVVVKKDGTKTEISIGDNEDDPVFCVTDLLPHLAAKQMGKKMSEGITGENLNILIGSIPTDSENDKIKEYVLNILNQKYGIIEEDFLSAEIEFVPSGCAKDLGLDKSMIGAYGHDDRVCAFGALQSILETSDNKNTAVCFLADKEEIGSMGNTGMMSEFFEFSIANLIKSQTDEFNELMLMECFSKSICLSADVSSAYDPNFKDVFDYLNASKLNYGVTICKYTGARGKSGSSDASAELMGHIRKLCNDNKIVWQIGELGKVDEGGGGTVAQYIANHNIETIDCGVPVLSMHSPFETVSKLDVYMSYKLYKVFYLD
ncbi:MAG: aminopeptidase [Clostridia bacterium]|nr:aminopeptidase [Clostridia bacterium]